MCVLCSGRVSRVKVSNEGQESSDMGWIYLWSPQPESGPMPVGAETQSRNLCWADPWDTVHFTWEGTRAD